MPAGPLTSVQRCTDGWTMQRGLATMLRAAEAEGLPPGTGQDDPQDQADDPGEANVEAGVQDDTV